MDVAVKLVDGHSEHNAVEGRPMDLSTRSLSEQLLAASFEPVLSPTCIHWRQVVQLETRGRSEYSVKSGARAPDTPCPGPGLVNLRHSLVTR